VHVHCHHLILHGGLVGEGGDHPPKNEDHSVDGSRVWCWRGHATHFFLKRVTRQKASWCISSGPKKMDLSLCFDKIVSAPLKPLKRKLIN